MAHSSSRPETGNGSFSTVVASSDATTAVTIRAQADSTLKMLLSDTVISTDTAMNLTIKDADGTNLIGPLYMPANSVFSKTWDPAIVCPVNKDLKILASTAGNISATVTGYDA